MNFKNKLANLVTESIISTQKAVKDFKPEKISNTLEKFQNNLDKKLENLKNKVDRNNASKMNTAYTDTSNSSESPVDNGSSSEIFTTVSANAALGIVERLNNKISKSSIDSIEIPENIKTILIDNGIKTVGQIQAMSDADLLNIKGIGKKTLEKIREFT